MTYGKKKFEDLDPQMRKLIPQLRKAMNDLIPLVDADTSAFDQYMVNIDKFKYEVITYQIICQSTCRTCAILPLYV